MNPICAKTKLSFSQTTQTKERNTLKKQQKTNKYRDNSGPRPPPLRLLVKGHLYPACEIKVRGGVGDESTWNHYDCKKSK